MVSTPATETLPQQQSQFRLNLNWLCSRQKFLNAHSTHNSVRDAHSIKQQSNHKLNRITMKYDSSAFFLVSLLSLPFALALSEREILVKLYSSSNGNRWKKVRAGNIQRSLLIKNWSINLHYALGTVLLVLMGNGTTRREWRAWICPTTGCQYMCTRHSGPFRISLKLTSREIPSRAIALRGLGNTIPPH